jgi:hypothetical protein
MTDEYTVRPGAGAELLRHGKKYVWRKHYFDPRDTRAAGYVRYRWADRTELWMRSDDERRLLKEARRKRKPYAVVPPAVPPPSQPLTLMATDRKAGARAGAGESSAAGMCESGDWPGALVPGPLVNDPARQGGPLRIDLARQGGELSNP